MLAGLLMAGNAKALSISTLDWLAADPTRELTIGDKIFSNFSYFQDNMSFFNASAIQVAATQVSDVEYLSWSGAMVLLSDGPATADLRLEYDVRATAGEIDWIDQSYTGSAQPLSGSFLAIDETVYDGNVISGFSHLQLDDLSDPFAEVGDDLTIIPSAYRLHVVKDIGFGITSPNGGFITVSDVKQSFHQHQVPDGGITLAMLGLALTGLAGLRRKLGA
jgi:hypothetical protein